MGKVTSPIRRTKKRMSNRRKESLITAGLIIAMLIGVCVVFVLLSQFTILHIDTVKIHGTQAINPEEIKSKVSKMIEGKYLYIIPKNHAFLVPRKKIAHFLESRYTRIETFTIDVAGGKTLSLDITERNPFALWCGHALSTTTPAEMAPDCYFADKAGYIFARAPYISDDEFFKIYGTPVSSDIHAEETLHVSLEDATLVSETADTFNMIGMRYIPENIFKTVMEFSSFLHSEGIESYALEVIEDEAQLHLTRGGVLKFRLRQNLGLTLADVILANAKKSEDADDSRTLEYIDVRFKNKIIFKYVDEPEPAVVQQAL